MNKYKNVPIEAFAVPPFAQNPREELLTEVDLGYMSHVHTRRMPKGASPALSNIKFRDGTIMKADGWTLQGTAAANPIRGFGFTPGTVYRHRFVVNGSTVTVQYYDAGWNNVTNTGTVLATSIILGHPILDSAGADYLVFAGATTLYQIDAITHTLTSISGTTGAISVLPFGNRLLAFGYGEPNAIGWSVNGDFQDWAGVGSGTLIYVDPNGQYVDQILSGAPLTAQTLAIFARGNIYRGFLTGNASQAIGVTSGISGLGCEAYGTAVPVGPLGVAFIGADHMVYLLNSAFNLTPIGEAIHKDLKAAGYNPMIVQGVYDRANGAYKIGVGSVIYTFNLKEFVTTGKKQWTRDTTAASVTAMGIGLPNSGEGILGSPVFADANNEVFSIDNSVTTRDSASFTGTWPSPTLNAPRRLATISQLTIYYQSPSASSVSVKVSEDGGQTWAETKVATLAQTTGQDGVVTLAFNSTGTDVRFAIDFDQTVAIRITGFQPVLIDRGPIEYD